MKVNKVGEIQKAEKKEKIINHTICTILGTCLYGTGVLLCVGVGMMIPSASIAVYSAYGLVGVGLGCLAIHVLKEDIKEYKKYKAKIKPYYEHFPFVVSENEYEKRPRYQIDREIDCKVEDFYKKESDYPTNFVYSKEDKQEQEEKTLAKKYRN